MLGQNLGCRFKDVCESATSSLFETSTVTAHVFECQNCLGLLKFTSFELYESGFATITDGRASESLVTETL
jgi:hypothetical protein